jgi:hypothetical protein
MLNDQHHSCPDVRLLKQFYDTFTGAATGAACYASFIGETFGLLVASYG